MKQLTIYCSDELSEEVNHVLHKYEIEGFIHIPGIYGNKLKPKGSYQRDQIWQATAFTVFPETEKLRGIIQDLQEYANQCDIKPCLRMVVVPVEQMY